MVDKTPSELRDMFGRNLRLLAADHSSVSELSRVLGINRTQFNRYLSGESFPRPDVLAKICSYFGTDARILLEPLEDIAPAQRSTHRAFLDGFLGQEAELIPEDQLPSGFYRFTRRSFIDQSLFVLGMVHVRRQDNQTVLRGFEAKNAMVMQGLPTDLNSREFRGIFIRQEDGLTVLTARQNAMTSSYNFLTRVASFQNNFWVGYTTRTVVESASGLRATRLAYEYLGPRVRDGLSAARSSGFCAQEELPPFHARLLRPEVPFS